MAPSTPHSDDSHQQLLDQLDLTLKPRRFRNTHWKPSQRRNKNIKQIVAEAARKEASVMATHDNSGSSTPNPQSSVMDTGAATPVLAYGVFTQSNISQAAQNLSTMVLERNLQASLSSGPVATYTNIESAPSLHPAHQKHYCDITGLPAPYTDPKSRLRYCNKEVFDVVRHLPQGAAEKYLEARGAHVVLKWHSWGYISARVWTLGPYEYQPFHHFTEEKFVRPAKSSPFHPSRPSRRKTSRKRSGLMWPDKYSPAWLCTDDPMEERRVSVTEPKDCCCQSDRW